MRYKASFVKINSGRPGPAEYWKTVYATDPNDADRQAKRMVRVGYSLSFVRSDEGAFRADSDNHD